MYDSRNAAAKNLLGEASSIANRTGGAIRCGPPLAAGEPAAEWDSIGEVVLVERLREAVRRLNPATTQSRSRAAQRASCGRCH